ncbi:MAG: hypothetical protein HQK53_12095 [Oligoflexia bacterium]|nr:hypothetical protein [Oligoflexia bacterium]
MIFLKQIQRSKKLGFGLMEAMVAVGVLGTGIYLTTYGIGSIFQAKGDLDRTVLINSTVDSLYKGISANPNIYKIDFKVADNDFLNATTYADLLSYKEKNNRELLTLAFDRDGIKNREDCTNCIGFLGYNIRPYTAGQGNRGLFLITIKVIYSPILDSDGKPQLMTYEFLTRG